MRANKKIIDRTDIAIFLLYISYVLPANYVIGDLVHDLLNISRLAVLVCILVAAIGKKTNNKKTPVAILIAALSVPLLSTMFNSAPSFKYGFWILVNNLLLFITTRHMVTKYCEKLAVAKWATAIGCLANSVSMMVLGSSGYISATHYYLMDHDNISFFYAFPSIMLAIVSDDMNKNRITLSTKLITLVHLLAYLVVDSLTAYVILAVVLLIEFTYNTKIYEIICKKKIIQVVFLILLFSILTIGSNRDLALLISDITGKSTTISGRTLIWEIALRRISERPLMGYGYEELWYRQEIFNISHIHNILLQLIYNGGVIHLSLLVLFYFKLAKKNMKHNSLLFLLLIATIFDFYLNKYLFIVPFALIDIDKKASACNIIKKEGVFLR